MTDSPTPLPEMVQRFTSSMHGTAGYLTKAYQDKQALRKWVMDRQSTELHYAKIEYAEKCRVINELFKELGKGFDTELESLETLMKFLGFPIPDLETSDLQRGVETDTVTATDAKLTDLADFTPGIPDGVPFYSTEHNKMLMYVNGILVDYLPTSESSATKEPSDDN